MTLRKIFDNLIALLGVETSDNSPQAMRDEAFAAIKAALQQMQGAGEDYYGREEVTIVLSAGTSAYTLDKAVQTVLDDPRIGSRTLKKLKTRSLFDNYGPLFLGKLSRAVPEGSPLAYLVESLRDTATGEEDNVKIRISIVPTPAATGSMLVPVIKEPPTYTAADLCNDSVPPVPHKYHESILLPLCRWNVVSSSYFSKPELLPALRDDRKRALIALGLVDPREQPRKQEAAAASQPEPATA